MRKIRRDTSFQINEETLKDLFEEHQEEQKRLDKMFKYYSNENEITKRVYKDASGNKPQNRLSHPYGDYITTIATGYLLGKPVTYLTEDSGLLETLTDVFKYNDEADNNSTLAKYSSIFGYAYEIMYSDEDANVRFKAIDPREMIVVYDNTLDEKILYAIRHYTNKVIVDGEETEITNIEVYTKPEVNGNSISKTGSIIYYTKKDDEITKSSEPEVVHNFIDVPVNIYINNDEMYGDFEKVIPLIDAYDKTQSDTANDFEMFTHAMLVISGEVVDSDDKEDIKDKFIINFTTSEGNAQYLIKNIQDTALENYKNRLDADIHKFACVPNMGDEKFSGNSSGVSLKFKLISLENKISVKEAKFKKGLMRRIELICHFLNIKKNDEYKYTDIEPTFTRSKPANELEIAQVMQILTGILSEETIISLFPAITDAQAEIKRKQEEENSKLDDYNTIEDNDNDVDGVESEQKQGVAVDEEKEE